MATVTIRDIGKKVTLEGIELADAQDIFRLYVVREAYGQIEVDGCKASTARSKLRDAGHRS